MKWYESETRTHQGLVIEEETGQNIAVVYDKINTALIAAAPELFNALESIKEWSYNETNIPTERLLALIRNAAQTAINKAGVLE